MNHDISRNKFLDPIVAAGYDKFYLDEPGKSIDRIEKETLIPHLKVLPKSHFLELGCGTGHWTTFFSEMGFQVTAVDNSEAMLEMAKSKEIQNTLFQKADAGNLPFDRNSFSAIISVTMLEFVDDITQVMNEIYRVLKPGGSLVLGCLNAHSPLGINKDNDPVFKHAHFFKPDEIKHMLESFGKPFISYGVYFSHDFKLLDGTENQNMAHPAFIAASVKKIK